MLTMPPTRVLVGATLLLCSLVHGCVSPESRAFRDARDQDSIGAYEAFLKQYPEARESNAAERRLAELEFPQVVSKDTIEAFDKYLAKYPRSPLARKATGAVARKRRETVDAAISDGSVDALLRAAIECHDPNTCNQIATLLKRRAYKDNGGLGGQDVAFLKMTCRHAGARCVVLADPPGVLHSTEGWAWTGRCLRDGEVVDELGTRVAAGSYGVVVAFDLARWSPLGTEIGMFGFDRTQIVCAHYEPSAGGYTVVIGQGIREGSMMVLPDHLPSTCFHWLAQGIEEVMISTRANEYKMEVALICRVTLRPGDRWEWQDFCTLPPAGVFVEKK